MSENFENRNEEENPIDERVWVAEEYLKKIEKDNGISQEIIAESLERLKRPLKRVDYKDFGEAEVKAENSEFSFSYILPSDQLKDEVDKYVFFKRLNDLCPDKPLELQDWRKLENMTFQVEDKKVSLLELLPENYNIIFNPSSEIFHGSVTDRNIYILGDITAPISIVTLLHEIGHIYDYKNSEKRSDNPQIEFGLHKETAETIRKERAASAFALKAMRPFLRKPQLKADVINFLEN